MKRVIKKRLGELLIEGGIINKDQLEEALAVHRETGSLLGAVLVEMDFARESDIVSVLAAQYGIPYLPLKQHEANLEVLSLLSREKAREYRCFPVDKMGPLMTVAMENPLDKKLVEEVKNATGCKVLCYVSTASEIEEAISENYAKLEKERAAAPAESSDEETEEGMKVFQVEDDGSSKINP